MEEWHSLTGYIKRFNRFLQFSNIALMYMFIRREKHKNNNCNFKHFISFMIWVKLTQFCCDLRQLLLKHTQIGLVIARARPHIIYITGRDQRVFLDTLQFWDGFTQDARQGSEGQRIHLFCCKEKSNND